MTSTEHEDAMIRAFVLRNKQERFLSFIKSPKNRKKFTGELANFNDFDQRYITSVPWKVDPTLSLWGRHLQGIQNVSGLLRSKGAGRTCWVISSNPKIDGQEMVLKAALESVVSSDWGTILSCIPGKLAYFKGEYDSYLLAK